MMNSYILYLNREPEQDVIDMRWKHVIKTINHDEHEVRVYVKVKTFTKKRENYHCHDKWQTKSFDNFYKEVIGEKKLDEEENNDDN